MEQVGSDWVDNAFESVKEGLKAECDSLDKLEAAVAKAKAELDDDSDEDITLEDKRTKNSDKGKEVERPATPTNKGNQTPTPGQTPTRPKSSKA